jgi:CHASE3 domain sensor protein
MKRSRSLVGFAVVVSSVVLIGAGVVANRTIGQLSKTGAAVLRAKEIELDYERLLSTLRDAETGQRGYLLTFDEAYLEPYQAARRELEQRMKAVADDAQGGGSMVDDLAALRELVDKRMKVLADTVELKRAEKHLAAIDVVRSGAGKRLMDEIRGLVGKQVHAQQLRVAHLQDVQRKALATSVRTSLIMSLLAITLVLLLVYIVRRDSRRVRESQNRLAITLRSIGDAVIATDNHGVVTMMNPIAENLTGWQTRTPSASRSTRCSTSSTRNTRGWWKVPCTKVLRKGGIVGLANHTVLIHRDKRETAIEDSGAPIVDRRWPHHGGGAGVPRRHHERAREKALHDADRARTNSSPRWRTSCAIRSRPSCRPRARRRTSATPSR